MLWFKALATFSGMASALTAVGFYAYYTKQIKEKKLPATTFYYREVQNTYPVAAAKWKDIHTNIAPKIADLYNKQQVSTCFMGWDNPRWLISPMQSRSAAGLLVENAAAENPAIAEVVKAKRMKKVQLPETRAMVLERDFGEEKNHFYRLLWWFMAKRYHARYAESMKKEGVAFFPMGEVRTAKGTMFFAPLPEDVKHYQFMATPEPEMNFSGNVNKKDFIPKTAKPFMTDHGKGPAKDATPLKVASEMPLTESTTKTAPIQHEPKPSAQELSKVEPHVVAAPSPVPIAKPATAASTPAALKAEPKEVHAQCECKCPGGVCKLQPKPRENKESK